MQVRRTEVVGPQVGEELTEQGGLALLFTFIGILIYVGFRFEKKMAAGTVLAAMHDPIVILGFFAATQMTFDLSVLAAVLAVIGYSINDTVVVFDRVREVFLRERKATPTEVLNTALNQTLSRTLMTSFSVLFVVVSLYLFGGETLKGFSLAIIVGVVRRHVLVDLRRRRAGARHERQGAGPDGGQEGGPRAEGHAVRKRQPLP